MSAYTGWGVALGLLLTLIYVALATIHKQRPELADAAELLLGALAGAGGVKLLVIAVSADELVPLGDEDRGYMVLGAVGVLWIAVATTARVLQTVVPGKRD